MLPLRLRLLGLWNTFKPQSYRPVIPSQVDHEALVSDIADALWQAPKRIRSLWSAYQGLMARKDHVGKLGQIGTTSSEEAFVLHCLLDFARPANLIEIGTYHGGSTRRILDSIEELQLDTAVFTYDIEDMVRHFRPDEAELILRDVSGRVDEEIFDRYPPGIIYLDAHPWQLLQDVARAALKREDWILAIHDCSPILCNPRMTIPKDEPRLISARTGHWERHVLADIFGVEDPLDERLDKLETESHSLRIFGSQHGLALIMPKVLVRA